VGFADFYNCSVGSFYDIGVAHIHDSTIGSLGVRAFFTEVTFYASDSSFAQSAADVIAQVVAPMVTVYDDNGDPIGEAPEPITITLNLGQGTYQDLTLSTQDSVTLIVNGINGSVGTVNGTNIVGNSPAVMVTGGNVTIQNVNFTTATDAPTILVTGGYLTLRNDIVQESTGYSDAAIAVSGGSTVDLGTAAGPGGNTINVNGAGQLVLSTGLNFVTAVGNTFQVNGAPIFPAATLALASSANPSLLNQPVTFTATVTPTKSGSASPTGNVTFVDTTTGSTLGIANVTGGQAQLTVSGVPVNTQTITAFYSGDANYISSAATVVQTVNYRFSGFLAPLNSNLTFGLNRVIPIKFQLSDYTNKFIGNLSAVTSLQVLNAQGANVLTSPGNTSLRYDSSANQFVANWSTKGLAAGSYTITLKLADGTVKIVTLQLTANGKSGATQMALGSDGGDNSGLADTLLAGDLNVYISDPNGYFTADELARIQDTINGLDTLLAPYGVTITEVGNSASSNLVLDASTTSACGGAANGVLGCFNGPAGEITILQGWNWYTGVDPTKIAPGQYDFQSTVTHEFGHALGLGGATDSSSPMYETLAIGQVHRTMTVADLNLLEPPQGPDPERAALPSWAGVNFLDVDNVAPHSNADGSTTSQDWNPDPQADNVVAAFSRTRDDARILANAATTTDFAGQTAQLLEKGPSDRNGT
jgi:hypothetical protein